jgi:hypothetical protein
MDQLREGGEVVLIDENKAVVRRLLVGFANQANVEVADESIFGYMAAPIGFGFARDTL